ncbi:hypothetical protein [Paenibacillus nasutitermitis]|uniref:Sugar phosphate isomerase/epimerase n=1 Tax=Paenibacillus nasutitermitis TaxID=1652958 RepID=A0A916ZFX8_9BACL|nr:hypothetical protein [Paenibacillus nasutitermitis]GGD95008.1 hypothetical protein GCM10010911_62090 [Paenibacillus nasutitermitis]
MMKIGIESKAYLYRYGIAEGLTLMKEHGYECLDYQDFIDTKTELFELSEAYFEKTLHDQRTAIEAAGIEISQSHGPWRWPPQDSTPDGIGDLHWLPYMGIIDWKDFTNALVEIGFDDSFSLETSVSEKIPDDIRGIHERALFASAKKLAAR